MRRGRINREIAHQIGVHALVFQVLQELAKAFQVHHARRLCQTPGNFSANVIDDGLQRFHRGIDEIRQRPDPYPRLGKVRTQGNQMFAFDLLQSRRFGAQIGKIAVRLKQRNGPGTRNDRDLRMRILGNIPTYRLCVTGTELKTLLFAARVPDQIG